VPFVIADATTLTEAGYVGEDVENIVLNLYQAAGSNLERTQKGIIYIDEIDKLAKKNFTASVSRDVSGEGVQQALLKILEGTKASVQIKGGKRQSQSNEHVEIDTTNILFIVGGSFQGLGKIIEHRMGKRSVGFGREAAVEEPTHGEKVTEDRPDILRHTTADDLASFGLIPEFIGRLPAVAVMDDLREDDLVHVLTEPKNALFKQYQKLLKFEKVKLTFTEGAAKAIARRALARKSGARGLRAIIESVMLDVMFDIPSVKGVSEVVITEDVVEGRAQPEYAGAREAGIPS
jgi:ATP-dependent Clp protease ATP-binding subunit ClpX